MIPVFEPDIGAGEIESVQHQAAPTIRPIRKMNLALPSIGTLPEAAM